jgi:hypothetical protein
MNTGRISDGFFPSFRKVIVHGEKNKLTIKKRLDLEPSLFSTI